MKKIIIALSAAILVLSACSKDEKVVKPLTLSATTELSAETKAHLTTFNGNVYPVLWSAGDQLLVINEDTGHASIFELIDGVNKTHAKFQIVDGAAAGFSAGIANGSTYEAGAYRILYPASGYLKETDGLSVPAYQVCVPGDVADGSITMKTIVSNLEEATNVVFSERSSFIAVKIKNFSTNSPKVMEIVVNDLNERHMNNVTLDCSNVAARQYYNVGLNACTLPAGSTITVKLENQTVKKFTLKQDIELPGATYTFFELDI